MLCRIYQALDIAIGGSQVLRQLALNIGALPIYACLGFEF